MCDFMLGLARILVLIFISCKHNTQGTSHIDPCLCHYTMFPDHHVFICTSTRGLQHLIMGASDLRHLLEKAFHLSRHCPTLSESANHECAGLKAELLNFICSE